MQRFLFIYFYRCSTGFRRFLRPSSGAHNCTYSFRYCQLILLLAAVMDEMEFHVIQVCWQLVSRSICSCSQAVSKTEWHIPLLCVQWKSPDDGQRNCSKHVDFPSKNKFEKLLLLVGFVIRNLSRCTVTWTSKWSVTLLHSASVKILSLTTQSASWNVCKNVNFYSCKWRNFLAVLWLPGLTVLQISVEIFLIALSYNLTFLLKEHVVLAIASFLTKKVASGIYCPGDIRCEAKKTMQ